jgi:hypothetical protein
MKPLGVRQRPNTAISSVISPAPRPHQPAALAEKPTDGHLTAHVMPTRQNKSQVTKKELQRSPTACASSYGETCVPVRGTISIVDRVSLSLLPSRVIFQNVTSSFHRVAKSTPTVPPG